MHMHTCMHACMHAKNLILTVAQCLSIMAAAYSQNLYSFPPNRPILFWLCRRLAVDLMLYVRYRVDSNTTGTQKKIGRVVTVNNGHCWMEIVLHNDHTNGFKTC